MSKTFPAGCMSGSCEVHCGSYDCTPHVEITRPYDLLKEFMDTCCEVGIEIASNSGGEVFNDVLECMALDYKEFPGVAADLRALKS